MGTLMTVGWRNPIETEACQYLPEIGAPNWSIYPWSLVAWKRCFKKFVLKNLNSKVANKQKGRGQNK